MTVAELIAILSTFDQQLPVVITDGYEGRTYPFLHKAEIQVFEDIDGTRYCDIGIGGCDKGGAE